MSYLLSFITAQDRGPFHVPFVVVCSKNCYYPCKANCGLFIPSFFPLQLCHMVTVMTSLPGARGMSAWTSIGLATKIPGNWLSFARFPFLLILLRVPGHCSFCPSSTCEERVVVGVDAYLVLVSQVSLSVKCKIFSSSWVYLVSTAQECRRLYALKLPYVRKPDCWHLQR